MTKLKYYRSGDVEKILGISVETLRFFENIGLIKPKRDPVNNYRYYSSIDLNKIVAYKFYRGFEFTLDETLDILVYGNKEVLDKLNEKYMDIKEKCEYYQNLLTRLLDLKKSFEEEQDFYDFKIEDSPEMLLYYNQINDKFETDEIFLENTRKYLEFLPFVYLAVHIPFEDGKLKDDVHYGYAVNTKFNKAVENLKHSIGRIYPSRKCIHTFVKVENNAPLCLNSLEQVFKFMKENDFILDGDVVGWILNEEILPHDVVRYFELWIPIKSKNDK